MNQEQYYKEVDIVEYFKVIYKHRWMVAVLIFISMFSVGILSLLKPKMYEASATFFPLGVKEYYNPESTGFTMKSQLGLENLVISILESRTMIDRVIEQLNLKDVWKMKFMSGMRNTLKKLTKITLERNGIIKISVTTESPQYSAKIANVYIDNLEYFNRELGIGTSSQLVQVIDRAVVPEEAIRRNTIKKTLLTGIASFIFAIFLVFFIEFIQKTDIIKKIIRNDAKK